MNNKLLVSNLLTLAFITTPALAAEFTGQYAMDYQQAGGALQVCVDVQGMGRCVDMSADVLIEGGATTEASIQAIADQAIARLESTTGRDLPDAAEDRLHDAVERAYDEAQDYLGLVIDELPNQMQLTQLDRSPTSITALLIDQAGLSQSAAGTINPQSGEFVLTGGIKGAISRESDYSGKALVNRAITFDWMDEAGIIELRLSGDMQLFLTLQMN